MCGDNRDIINKKPTGSVRISLGAMTTIDDVLAFITFAKKHFIETIPPVGKSVRLSESFVRQLWKGYTAANPQLQIVQQILMYGQDWMLVDASFGSALNTKG